MIHDRVNRKIYPNKLDNWTTMPNKEQYDHQIFGHESRRLGRDLMGVSALGWPTALAVQLNDQVEAP